MKLPLPPARFKEVEELTLARLRALPPVFAGRKQKLEGARAFGVRYEKKVHEEMLRLFPEWYLPSPWFEFYDRHGRRWCQPDGLLIDLTQREIVIIEVKSSHTGEAWWKLWRMYLPVVQKVFGPDFRYRCLEIVRYYDPDILFPGAKLCEHMHLAPTCPATGVHIMRLSGR